MATTLLIVEFLVVGIQAALWIFVLILACGIQWSEVALALKSFKEYAAFFTLISISVLYSIGISIDGFTAWIEEKYRKRAKKSMCPSGTDQKRNSKKRSKKGEILAKNKSAYDAVLQLEFYARLLRSTFFNILLLTLCSIGYMAIDFSYTKLLLISVLLLLLSFCWEAFKRRTARANLRKTQILEEVRSVHYQMLNNANSAGVKGRATD